MTGGHIPFPTWLNPEIVPGLPLRWYGLMYLVAFYITYRLLRLRIAERNLGVNRETVLNLFFWGIVGVLIGGRLLSVTVYDPSGYYLRNPLQIILPFVRESGRLRFVGLQGMAYHGGLLGAIVAVALYCRAKRLPVAEWLDMIAACTPLGYTFGRLGNFINGELFGRVTTVPWGMVFPGAPGFPAEQAWVRQMAERSGIDIGPELLVNLARHPSQLYEAALEGLLLFAVLWFVLRKRAPFPGVLFSAYLIGYGIARFVVEYVRQPDPGLDFPIMLVRVANPSQTSLLNFTTGQILSAIMIAAGVTVFFLCRRRARQAGSVSQAGSVPGGGAPGRRPGDAAAGGSARAPAPSSGSGRPGSGRSRRRSGRSRRRRAAARRSHPS